MKKFLLKILLLVVLFVILGVPLDICLSRQFKNTTDYRFAVWNDIIDGNMQNDIIIMGSSRAWVQISPQILDSILHISSYNIGIDGSKINRQIPRFKMYCERNSKPKIVLQNVDWGSTLSANNEKENNYIKEQYFPYFYNRDMRRIVLQEENFDFFDLYVPFLRYVRYSNFDRINQILKDVANPGWDVVKGYKGLERTWDGSHLRKVDSLYFVYGNESKEYFCQYLQYCKEENIKVIFVYTPFYIGGTRKVSNLNDFYSLFDSIANLYDVTILNYLNDSICYDTLNFYNAMHLNKTGAEKFTRILAHDLDSLGVLKQ